MHTKRGFTLIEIIIAISISLLIMAGLSTFLIKTNTMIYTAQRKGDIYISLTDAVDRINSLKRSYSSGSLFIDDPNGYDVLLFTDTGATSGVLVGVVDNDPTSTGYLLLDATGSYATYGNKALGIQELSQSQLSSLTITGAYSIPFHADKVFPSLLPKTFSVVAYNSGTIFDTHLELFPAYFSSYRGKPLSSIPMEDAPGSINLDF